MTILVSFLLVLFLATGAQAESGMINLDGQSAAHIPALKIESSKPDSAKAQGHNPSFLHRYGPWIVATAAGAALFAVDEDINTFSQRRSLHSRAANRFFSPIEDFGRGGPYAIAVPLLVGHGLIFKKNKTIVAGAELLVSLVVEEAITQPVKAAFGRKRPYESSSPFRFFKGGTSFYSGHTITAFTFATIISKNFPRQDLGFVGIHHDVPVVPALMYTTAGLVGIQRLLSDNHWPSDVYYGALAGYAVGSIVIHFGNKVHLKGFAMAPGKTPIMAACFSF